MPTKLEDHKITHIQLGLDFFGYNPTDFQVVNNLLEILDSGIDHGSISGLTHDDHSQYLLLAGRSGQTIEDNLNIGPSTATTASVVELGGQSSGDRQANLNLITDDTYTDWSLTLQSSAGKDGARYLASRGTGDLVIKTVDAGDIHFGTTNNEDRMVILDSGEIGIGLNNPLAQLSVTSSVDTSATWWTDVAATLLLNNSTSEAAVLKFATSPARVVFGTGVDTDELVFTSRQSEDTANEYISFDNNCQVGLGIPPAEKLSVRGSFAAYDSSGNGLYWSEHRVPASSVSPGASGATLMVGGPGSASLYWLLDATNEYLYFTSDIEDDWDEASDIVVEINVALNANETASDTIDAEIIAEYFDEHEDMDTAKTQTRTIAHDIGNFNSAGDVHYLKFIIDYDLVNNLVKEDDIMKLRFRINSIASVAAVRYLYGSVKYRTKYPREETGGAFPSEG